MITKQLRGFNAHYCRNLFKKIPNKYRVDTNKNIKTDIFGPRDIGITPFVHNGETNQKASNEFARFLKNDDTITVDRGTINSRRKYYKSSLYRDALINYTLEFFNRFEEHIPTYKGYHLNAGDTSIICFSNKEKSLDEFNVGYDVEGERELPRARLSCITNVLTGHVLGLKLDEEGVGEVKLAVEHLRELAKHYDLTKHIFIFDRGYPAMEIILFLMEIGSHFVIRTTDEKFNAEFEKMESDDQFVEFSTSGRLSNVSPELKAIYKEKRAPDMRVTKIPLKENEIERLISNLPMETFTTADMKEIYRLRWGIETLFNELKYTHEIENFTGEKRIIIEQDTYATILLHNIIMTEKLAIEQMKAYKLKNKKQKRKRITVENEITGEIEIRYLTTNYKHTVNVNKLTGNIKSHIYKLFYSKKEIIDKYFDLIECDALLCLNHIKIDRFINFERKKGDSINRFQANKKRA